MLRSCPPFSIPPLLSTFAALVALGAPSAALALTVEFTDEAQFDAVKGATTVIDFDALPAGTSYAGDGVDLGGVTITHSGGSPSPTYYVIDPTDPANPANPTPPITLSTDSLASTPHGLSSDYFYNGSSEIDAVAVFSSSHDTLTPDTPATAFGVWVGDLGPDRVRFHYSTQGGSNFVSAWLNGDEFGVPDPDLILEPGGNSRIFWGVVSDDPITAVVIDTFQASPDPTPTARFGIVLDDIEFGSGSPLGATLSSDFETGTESWTPTGGILSHSASGGNPDGHIRWEDDSSGFGFVNAPFSGDLSSYTGSQLSFDIAHLFDNGDTTFFTEAGEVTVSGPGGSMTLDVVLTQPTSTWTSHSVTFSPEVWGVDDVTWSSIVSNVTSISILVDIQDTFGDIAGIDNFSLGPEPQCSDQWDNDLDGDADFPADSSCASAAGADEAPACDDGVDNDLDGGVDFPSDLQCFSAQQPFEKFGIFPEVYEISQESSAGLGDFDSNVLGYIGSIAAPSTASSFYAYDNPIADSYNGGVVEPGKKLSLLFGVTDTTTGDDSLVVLHSRPHDDAVGLALLDIEVLGTTAASVDLLDDPDQNDTVQVTPGVSSTDIELRNDWGACCTDGAVIGQLGDGWDALVEFRALPSGLTRWHAVSASGEFLELQIAANRRVRVRHLPEPPLAATALASAALLGALQRLRRRCG